MRRSIATVCLSGGIESKLKAIAAAGFEAAEIFENDLIVSTMSPREVASLATDNGLSIDLYQPFRDFESVAEPVFRENLRRAVAKFEVMKELGTDLLLVCSNVATASVDDDEVAADQLRSLAEAAADHGMRIAYEALAWGRYVSDIEHSNRIVELVDHPALGHCIDSFHMLSRGWTGASIDMLPAEKIFFCQIADATRLDMDVLSWSRHHRVFPGEGGWDLADFMAHVSASGYAGTVSLEIFNDVFRQTPINRTAADAMRSLVWLEDQTARRLEVHPVDRENPVSTMEFARLPTVVQPTDFNFAEVKTTGEPRLDTVLSQLGFESRGAHRTKPVELWSRGNARVIVNAQTNDTFAPFISAVGFDVDDPATAAVRAEALLGVPVPRDSADGEEVLWGFSAPDAREIFLCKGTPGREPTWAEEFGPSRSVSDVKTLQIEGITRIDHVNLAQPWQFFDEAVLFYESTLSLSPQPSLEVAAPNGLVRSQVMRSTDGAIRLALNVAPLLAESLAPVEHIAFSCNDIIATARAAADRGLQALAIPQNYYDDLAARFPLSVDELSVLRELNLLYDRDSSGEFLQFYTPTVGNVFFEVIERRGDYQGFGAGNAPVRLAAQFEHTRLLAR